MVKKILALILVAFFVLGGSNQKILAADGYSCEISWRKAGTGGSFTNGSITISTGDDIEVQVRNLQQYGNRVNPSSKKVEFVPSNNSNGQVRVDSSYISEEGINAFVIPWESFVWGDGFDVRRNSVILEIDDVVACQSKAAVTMPSCQTGWIVPSPNGDSRLYNQIVEGDEVSLRLYSNGTVGFNGLYYLTVTDPNGSQIRSFELNTGAGNTLGHLYYTIHGSSQGIGRVERGVYGIEVLDSLRRKSCSYAFRVCELGDTDCKIDENIDERVKIAKFSLCGQLTGDQKIACEECADLDADGNPTRVYSAIGCIPIDERGFIRQMIQLLLSVSGLIALLSILAGAFLLSTSQGDSNQVKKAKELITAAVSGLLFIIFSTIILDFIGVQVLRIPGLS